MASKTGFLTKLQIIICKKRRNLTGSAIYSTKLTYLYTKMIAVLYTYYRYHTSGYHNVKDKAFSYYKRKS
jgi:hypothetical protein